MSQPALEAEFVASSSVASSSDEDPSATAVRKIARIRSGAKPRALDLFAGCGGISLGYQLAGFSIEGAVELDPEAARSHALNFHRHEPPYVIDCHAKPRDITTTEANKLASELGWTDAVHEAIDVVVGGPPCQAFARVGRAKLREVAAHPEAFLNDPRSNLYLRYLDYVEHLEPVVVMMENVPDVLNFGGHNIAEEMCEVLEELGYRARYTMLNAAFYGVPQMRERMFLLAYRNEIGVEPSFPVPTTWIDLPRGYTGSRQVALKSLTLGRFNRDSHYVDPPKPPPGCPPAVTAREATGDLAPISEHLNGGMRRGARHFDTLVPYRAVRMNNYARLMRRWPGFEADGVRDHVIRSLPRDYALFKVMNPGDQYPEAYRHALKLLDKKLDQSEGATGRRPQKGSREFERLLAETVPPYDHTKFPNKWRKMEPDLPARTLMAHIGKDTYSHIHYDSDQARTISVREAARLQSFPDGFVFAGKMNSAFRQIGNAVPPLLAFAVATEVRKVLDRATLRP